jgi:hypothetical protein
VADGALGMCVVLVEDPDATVRQRWAQRSEPQAHGRGRPSRLRRAKAEALAELARKAARARWAKTTPELRTATVAALNAARAAKRRTRTNEAA